MKFALILLLVLVGCAQDPVERVDTGDYEVVLLASGLEHPWALVFLPDGRMLVTERPGRLRIVEDGVVSDPVEGLPDIAAGGQGGLLDIALHPDFEENSLVYFTYSARVDEGTTTRLARARFEDALHDVEVLFTATPGRTSTVHYGSRIVLTDEHVFVSIGDRGDMDSAQDTTTHAGTIVRLHHDGRIPDDNPFVADPDVLDEIYAYGVRNPQGLIWRADREELWAHEHGPQGGDEVNIIRAGRNYGWPLFTYGEQYGGGAIGLEERPAGVEAALHHWTPSIAPSGFAHYTGDDLAEWTSDLFVGALAGQRLARLRFEDTQLVEEEHLLTGEIGRIRDVREGPGGLYLLTDERNGGLYSIVS